MWETEANNSVHKLTVQMNQTSNNFYPQVSYWWQVRKPISDTGFKKIIMIKKGIATFYFKFTSYYSDVVFYKLIVLWKTQSKLWDLN